MVWAVTCKQNWRHNWEDCWVTHQTQRTYMVAHDSTIHLHCAYRAYSAHTEVLNEILVTLKHTVCCNRKRRGLFWKLRKWACSDEQEFLAMGATDRFRTVEGKIMNSARLHACSIIVTCRSTCLLLKRMTSMQKKNISPNLSPQTTR